MWIWMRSITGTSVVQDYLIFMYSLTQKLLTEDFSAVVGAQVASTKAFIKDVAPSLIQEKKQIKGRIEIPNKKGWELLSKPSVQKLDEKKILLVKNYFNLSRKDQKTQLNVCQKVMSPFGIITSSTNPRNQKEKIPAGWCLFTVTPWKLGEFCSFFLLKVKCIVWLMFIFHKLLSFKNSNGLLHKLIRLLQFNLEILAVVAPLPFHLNQYLGRGLLMLPNHWQECHTLWWWDSYSGLKSHKDILFSFSWKKKIEAQILAKTRKKTERMTNLELSENTPIQNEPLKNDPNKQIFFQTLQNSICWGFAPDLILEFHHRQRLEMTEQRNRNQCPWITWKKEDHCLEWNLGDCFQ